MYIYKAVIHKEYQIVAPTMEDALDEVFHIADIDSDDIQIECIGEQEED